MQVVVDGSGFGFPDNVCLEKLIQKATTGKILSASGQVTVYALMVSPELS
jgi:hypothetical protein